MSLIPGSVESLDQTGLTEVSVKKCFADQPLSRTDSVLARAFTRRRKIIENTSPNASSAHGVETMTCSLSHREAIYAAVSMVKSANSGHRPEGAEFRFSVWF